MNKKYNSGNNHKWQDDWDIDEQGELNEELADSEMTRPDSIIGKKAMIKEDNDNENYEKFRGKTLIVTNADRGGLGYDNSVYPELLCSFKLANGRKVPFSLYEYEFDIL